LRLRSKAPGSENGLHFAESEIRARSFQTCANGVFRFADHVFFVIIIVTRYRSSRKSPNKHARRERTGSSVQKKTASICQKCNRLRWTSLIAKSQCSSTRRKSSGARSRRTWPYLAPRQLDLKQAICEFGPVALSMLFSRFIHSNH